MTAARPKFTILVAGVNSYLGTSLALSLLNKGHVVTGIGKKHLLPDLIKRKNFTFIDLDLSQPLPVYLERFDLIFYQLTKSPNLAKSSDLFASSQIELTSLLREAKSRLAITASLDQEEELTAYLLNKNQATFDLFLVGDLYGPEMTETFDSPNNLASLIAQALQTDKIILEKDGLTPIYPAYVSDVLTSIEKSIFDKDEPKTYFLFSEPTTALSVTYEIQNSARLVLAKELELFFKDAAGESLENEATTHHNSDLDPQVSLKEGLKKTFEYYRNHHPQEKLMPTSTVDLAAFVKKPAPHEPAQDQKPTKTSPKTTKNFRKFFLASLILIFFILLLVKSGLDLYLGTSSLKESQVQLASANFTRAKTKAQDTLSSFRAAKRQVRIFTFPASFLLSEQTQSIDFSLAALEQTAQGLVYFTSGSETLVKNLSIIANVESKEELDHQNAQVNFKRAYLASAKASHLAKLAKNHSLFKPQMESLANLLTDFNNRTLMTFEFVNLTSDLTGQGTPKTYLVLLQNNTELRPGGGFIGNVGKIEFKDGRLQKITVEDVYTYDGQLTEKIEPPAPLKDKLKVDQFYLRDSNWSPDFSLNSATARDFFKKETGESVDGVIALDLDFVQKLLAKVGPINLSDYNEQITDKNLFERGEYYSEVGFFPGSTQKRDFFGSVSRNLITKIVESLKNPQDDPSLVGLISILDESLSGKHLMLSFDNPNLASYIKTKGWDAPLPPTSFNVGDDSIATRDFLALSEANLGANKVNRFLDRQISYEMTIGRDADLVAKLKITYTNNSPAETWPAGKYVNFLRVYVPFAASLFEYQNGQDRDLQNVAVDLQNNLTVFSTYVEVPIKSTKEVIFTYRIPKNIKLETTPMYHLYVQKQPGTGQDPFEFKFNLPAYLAVKSINGENDQEGRQNLEIKTDLSTDRQFQIEVTKK